MDLNETFNEIVHEIFRTMDDYGFFNGILMIISWDPSFKSNGMFQDIPLIK